ncbi:MAG: MATE family efflux transporter, partial [Clostridiaceae bacterium]|nr:MATE family efflux transporter [Clostridiaceae bacterium]
QLKDVNAMSGIGLTTPLTLIALGFMLLVGIGTTASISIRLGEKRHDEAEQLLANGFTLALAAGFLLTLAGQLFLRPVLRLAGASPATLPYAVDYMQIILWGAVPNTIGFAMNHTIRGAGNPRRSASTQILGAGLNIVLDPILIFGLDMGVRGAALATVISQIVSAAWVLSYFTGSGSNLKLRPRLMRLKARAVGQILSIGLSPFAMQVAASLVSVFANRALRANGGDVAIGAMTVINSVTILFFMPILGINQGLQPILGYNYGAGSFNRVREAWRFGVLLASAIVAVGFAVVQLFPQAIIRIFIDDAGLVAVGTRGLRIFLAMLPLLGFQVISTVYFQSVGKPRVAIVASLLRQVIILLPLYLFLPGWLGLTGVWLASPIADFSSFAITAFLILREMRQLKKLSAGLPATAGHPPAAHSAGGPASGR